MGQKFCQIVLSSMVRKFENSKWPPFFARQNFFENWDGYVFLCFAILAKNSKIQNGRQFGRDKTFLKIGMTTLQRHPVGQNFRPNPFI